LFDNGRRTEAFEGPFFEKPLISEVQSSVLPQRSELGHQDGRIKCGQHSVRFWAQLEAELRVASEFRHNCPPALTLLVGVLPVNRRLVRGQHAKDGVEDDLVQQLGGTTTLFPRL
jgi:hypothetical protein